jgi:hypothetical protein
MILTFRPIKVWPEGWQDPTRKRSRSPFSSSYSDTLNLLERELRHLGVKEATLQVDADERGVRLDGQLRADAKVSHPGVILTLETRSLGTLVYACDAFTVGYRGTAWQENLRAIALGLEALRRVERYGIAERGQQYAGYRELPSGIPIGTGLPSWSVEEAAAFIAEQAGAPASAEDVLADVKGAYRQAAKRLHPDVGGNPELFRRLEHARRIIEATP